MHSDTTMMVPVGYYNDEPAIYRSLYHSMYHVAYASHSEISVLGGP
jgi:hypothetical protein